MALGNRGAKRFRVKKMECPLNIKIGCYVLGCQGEYDQVLRLFVPGLPKKIIGGTVQL